MGAALLVLVAGCGEDGADRGSRGDGVGSGGSSVGGTAGAPVPAPTGAGDSNGVLPPAEPGGGPAEPNNPSSIAFDWPEDTGAQGPPCRAGRYVGRFDGMYTSPATGIGFPVPVEGEIDFTLMESQQGEFFDIAEGRVIGLANGLFPFSADIVGTLDCPLGVLVDAGLQNGTYNAFGTDYFFEGPISANYDRPTSSFPAGTWTVVEPGAPPGLFGEFGGSGTWNAVHAP